MRSLASLVLCAAAAASFSQDTVALKRSAKVGDTAKYSLKVDTEVQGMAIVYAATLTETVTKFEADGTYEITSAQSDAKLTVNGSASNTDPQGASKTTYKPDGSVIELKGEETGTDAYRMANIQLVIWPKEPVGPGSKWTGEIAANKDRETPEVKASYEVLAKETIGSHTVFKVAFTTKEQSGENPAGAVGTAWIDTTTGLMVKVEAEWKNAPIAGTVLSGKVAISIIE